MPQMLFRLRDMVIEEVSLVTQGANRKKFLVRKADGSVSIIETGAGAALNEALEKLGEAVVGFLDSGMPAVHLDVETVRKVGAFLLALDPTQQMDPTAVLLRMQAHVDALAAYAETLDKDKLVGEVRALAKAYKAEDGSMNKSAQSRVRDQIVRRAKRITARLQAGKVSKATVEDAKKLLSSLREVLKRTPRRCMKVDGVEGEPGLEAVLSAAATGNEDAINHLDDLEEHEQAEAALDEADAAVTAASAEPPPEVLAAPEAPTEPIQEPAPTSSPEMIQLMAKLSELSTKFDALTKQHTELQTQVAKQQQTPTPPAANPDPPVEAPPQDDPRRKVLFPQNYNDPENQVAYEQAYGKLV